MQFMFLQKPESSKSRTIFTTEEERQVLRQISVEDIDSFCEEAEHRKINTEGFPGVVPPRCLPSYLSGLDL